MRRSNLRGHAPRGDHGNFNFPNLIFLNFRCSRVVWPPSLARRVYFARSVILDRKWRPIAGCIWMRLCIMASRFPFVRAFTCSCGCVKWKTLEDLNAITALKFNKHLSVITFGLKCNNVIPTPSVTLLTCCWLLVVISCVIGHIIKKVSEHVFSGLSREWRRHHTKLRFSLSDCFLTRAFCKLSQSMKFTTLLAAQ